MRRTQPLLDRSILLCVAVSISAMTAACSSSHSQTATANKPPAVSTSVASTHVDVTMLFGVPLRGHHRAELLAALERQHLVPKEVAPGRFEVPADQLLDGAENLWLQFDGDEFAMGAYDFPSDMDIEQVTRVGKMVAAKYGKPDGQKGDPQVGQFGYTWKRPDGVVIIAVRGWPNTTTQLLYGVPDVAARFDKAQEAASQREQEQDAKRQDKAF